MITYHTLIIDGEKRAIQIIVPCYLSSLADVNEVIGKLVKAKNTAFPSGGEEHRKQMEALTGGDRHDTQPENR